MNRRQFSQILAGAALGAAAPSIPAEVVSSPLPFKLSIMLWTIYPKLKIDERLEKVAEAGYHAIELVNEFKSWSESDFVRFKRKRQSLNIVVDATAGLKTGIVDPTMRAAFLTELTNFLNVADKLECSTIIVLSGNRVAGLSHQQQHDACVETLKPAAEIVAKRNMTLLLENIDPEENPNYYLTSAAEGFEIMRQVNHPHLRLLYDFYHEQIAEGNLIEKLEKNIDYTGLVHIADVPGRHQPGTGEINYANIFRKLVELKYPRYAAMEFFPSGDPVQILRAARELAERAGGGKHAA